MPRVRISCCRGWIVILLALPGRAPLAAQRVDHIQVVPVIMKLAVGDTGSARFMLMASDASVVPSSNATLGVSSNRPSVALVVREQDRLVITAVSPGSAIITIRAGDIQPGRVKVEVEARAGSPRNTPSAAPAHPSSPPAASPTVSAAELRVPVAHLRLAVGERDRIRAEALDASGVVLANAPIRFQLYTGNVIALDTVSGAVSALSPGEVFVGINVPGAQGQVVSVKVEALALRVDPDTLWVLPGNRDTLRLVVPALERGYLGPVTWVSTNPAVLTVDPASGAVTAVGTTGEAVSTVSVRAAAGGRDTYGTVLVMQPPPHPAGGLLFSVGEAPEQLLLPIGDSHALRGVAVNERRDTMYQLPIRWDLANDSGVVTLDRTTSRLTAGRQGVDTLIARLLLRMSPREFRWPIRVVAGGVSFSKSRFGMRLGQRDSFPVAMVDSAGNPTGDRVPVQWTAQPATVAQHRGNGVIEALSPGRAEITAQTPWDSITRATLLVPPDLVYSHRAVEGSRFARLLGVDLRTGATTPLAVTEANDAQPAVSPDRTRIAFIRIKGAGDQNVWVMDVDGQNAINVTGSLANAKGPFWSHDGRALFYVAAVGGQLERLYITEIDGKNPRPFLSDTLPVISAAASPDGRFLTYSTLRQGKYDLYQVPLATTGPLTPNGEARQLVSLPNRDLMQPQYSLATGDLYFIQKERGGKSTQTLMRMPASAHQAQPVSPPGLQILSFAVAPDGNQVVAVAIKPGSTAREPKTALYNLDVRQVAAAPPIPWREEGGVTFATPAFTP